MIQGSLLTHRFDYKTLEKWSIKKTPNQYIDLFPGNPKAMNTA
jgi:hypothetical protein